jgi:hypothetical protein
MSLFDGMAGVLTGVFGAPTTYRPKGDVARTVDAVCRNGPIEVTDAEGHTVMILSPTLRVRRDLAPELARGDIVLPSAPVTMAGRTFEVINMLPSGSPAQDSFLIAELEEVDP